MYNKDLFEKLRQEFGDENMPKFCEMISEMYNILCEEGGDLEGLVNNEEGKRNYRRDEYDFERYWWNDKFEGLTL